MQRLVYGRGTEQCNSARVAEPCRSSNVWAELLSRANELAKNNIHPTTIIAGYRLAMRESIKYIQATLANALTQAQALRIDPFKRGGRL
eukprot:3399715-Amphidinium_carterae.1